mgnify:CR=1 FL=1
MHCAFIQYRDSGDCVGVRSRALRFPRGQVLNFVDFCFSRPDPPLTVARAVLYI